MAEYGNYRFETDYRKDGTLLIAKSDRRAKVAGSVGPISVYKKRHVKLFPTMIVYKRSDNSEVRFLLGPLAFTDIEQIEDTILKIVCYPKKKDENVDKMAIFKSDASRGRKLVLKFKDRVERAEWMKLIVEECETNYLDDLISQEDNCTHGFLRKANEEIWLRILSDKGDDCLRQALASSPGSDHIELVRMIAAVVVDWLKVVLKINLLYSYHREAFTTLFSFLLENTCARALFILLRPSEHFLDDFSEVCKAFVVPEREPKPNDPPVVQLQRLYYLDGFLRHLIAVLRSDSWQKFRVFLSIVNHPSLPAHATSLQEVDHLTELKWIKEHWSQCTEATWAMFKFGLTESPYFSFYFVQREILDVIDDQRVRKVLYLMQRVPKEQKEMEFEADRVLRKRRKHFETLTNFCKFREMWKIFCATQRQEHDRLFYNEVHKLIWNCMEGDSPQTELRLMFLPTHVTHTMPTLLQVLHGEIVKTVNVDLLNNLDIQCAQMPQTVNEDGMSAIDSTRNFLVNRVCRWVAALIGRRSLIKEDAETYVSRLVACDKSAIVRALMWLVLPPRCSHADDIADADADTGITTETVLKTLDTLSTLFTWSESSLLSQQFMSFLIIAEHPLAAQVTASNMLEALNEGGAKLTWSDESAWMKSVHSWSNTWTLSKNEWRLLCSGTPYFALQLLLRRLSLDRGNFSHLSVLITQLPMSVKEVSFKADINMSVEVRFQTSLELDAQHFLDFLDCRRIREIWRVIQTDFLTWSTEFEEETLHQLLVMLIQQRLNQDSVTFQNNAFQRMMKRLNAADQASHQSLNVLQAGFEHIIHLLLEMQIHSKDDVLSSLFSSIPVRVFTNEETESLKWSNAQLKSFLEYMGKFCAEYHLKDHLDVSTCSDFVQLLVACMENPVMRAYFVLVKPVCKSRGSVSMSTVVNYLANNQNHILTLYLLKLLEHPAIKEVKHVVPDSDDDTDEDEEDSTTAATVVVNADSSSRQALKVVPVSWKEESEWLWKIEETSQLVIDEVDFALLSNPAYLLLRHVTRHFSILDNEIIHTTLDQLYKLTDLISLDVTFKAQVNYYPCIHSLVQAGLVTSTTLINAPHFDHIRSYCLFHHVWRLLMPQLLLPTAEADFVDAVVWKLWRVVSKKEEDVEDYTEMSKVFCPTKDCIMDWILDSVDIPLTYTKALQKYALVKIVQFVDAELVSKVIPDFTLPEMIYIFESDVEAHNLLMEKISLWMHALLDAQRPSHEWYAVLFVTLLEAAMADVAVRALIVLVVPTRSLVLDFMKHRKITPSGPVSYAQAALKFLALMYDTVEDDEWYDLRSFMSILDHPVTHAGTEQETLPVWKDEAKWIKSRCAMKPVVLSWSQFASCLTPHKPYILLLFMTRCISSPDLQYLALSKIPDRHLDAKFNVEFASSINRIGDSQHFINMCLTGSVTFTNATAASDAGASDEFVSPMSVFQHRNRVSDAFFRALLTEACMDASNPRSLQVYNLLQTTLFDASGGWNMGMLKLVPNISAVIITFLHQMSSKRDLKIDEMIVGCLIMLVLQLESCNTNKEIAESSELASKWMRGSGKNRAMFFDSLERLNFHKWFHRLVSKNAGVYGPLSASFKINDPEIKEKFESNMILNDSMALNKTKLTKSIIGYYCLCAEFAPEPGPDLLMTFIKSLGNGRPFFTNLLHSKEHLGQVIPKALCRIMGITESTGLYKRIISKELYYDNDHASVESLKTLQLRQNNKHCQKLTDEEFSNLLTVAWYTHDLKNLSLRFENAANLLTREDAKAKRQMAEKIIKWIIEMFIAPDVVRENDPTNKDSNDRLKWTHCEKFTGISFETVFDCIEQATISSHLLRNNPKAQSTLDMLFRHYLQHSPPSKWKEQFIGCKTIAFFIKYVDAEDLGLAFKMFSTLNESNKCLLKYLLMVRKMVRRPVVSGKDLVMLTTSAGDGEENNKKFFEKLMQTGNAQKSPDMVLMYRLTSKWMKISKKKILFPLPPRNAQIITLLTVGAWAKDLLVNKNKSIGRALIGQVGTGEGKSLIIAMAAIYFVKILKKRVHILENNPGLLEKDVATMAPLYKEFGIERRAEGEASEQKKDLTYTTQESLSTKDVRNEFCKFGVTYTLRRNVERYYQDCIMNGDPYPMRNTVLIVDEVDDLIVDKNPNQPFATSDAQRDEYKLAFMHFKDYADLPEIRENNFVWNMAQRQVSEAKEMEPKVDYTVMNGEYCLLENGRPVMCYDGRLEYLKFTQRNTPPVLKTCYYVQSIPYMLSQYNCITGFSGSLGSPAERKFLTEQYKVWCFDTPNFLNTCIGVTKVPPLLMVEPSIGKACVHVYPSAEQHMNKIVEIAARMYLKVPVLIIAKNTEEAYKIETKIRLTIKSHIIGGGDKSDDFVQMFMEYKKGTVTLDSQNWGNIVQRATDKKGKDRFMITITDPFGGRGHDFDVNDDVVNDLGGLLVIMTSLPESEREWKQWKGRTGRKDTNGQYATVLNKMDPLLANNAAVLASCQLSVGGGNMYSEELIQKLLDKQDEGMAAKLAGMEKDLKRGKRLNRLCDQFYARFGVMREETWPFEHQIFLRDLLVKYASGMLTETEINEFFEKYELHEFDEDDATSVASPNVTAASFWSADDQETWDRLAKLAEAGEELEEDTEEAKVEQEKPGDKPADKPHDKPADKPHDKPADTQETVSDNKQDSNSEKKEDDNKSEDSSSYAASDSDEESGGIAATLTSGVAAAVAAAASAVASVASYIG